MSRSLLRSLPSRLAGRNVRPAISILCLTLLSIPALQPLLAADLTCGYDNVLHLWRALETDALLEGGLVYSRWQPHVALGFGYPLLLFNPPISPLVAALFHRVGLAWPTAINATFCLGALLSAWTAWLLVREWWGDLAGVVAGVMIVTLPFHAYVNFHRASMSEALAWAFPPLVLWGLIRWQKHGQRRGLLAAAVGEAALLLTHDASAYLFLPLPLATVAALALAHRSWHSLGRGLLALVLGAGLAAFFWLPSVLERSYVQFDRVLDYPYAASFVALDYLLEPPRPADPTLINPWWPKGIGLLPALLVLLVPLTWPRATREQRWWLAAVGLVTAGCIGLTLPYAWPIWRLIPILPYLHFPWRFLTPAAVGVAALGGAGTYAMVHLAPVGQFAQIVSLTKPGSHQALRLHSGQALRLRSGQAPRTPRRATGTRPALWAPIVAGGLVLGALGWLYPPHCSLPQPATLAGMLAYERATGNLGGTTFSELLPVWVRKMPAERTLIHDVEAGQEPTRLPAETLPAGARVVRADYGPTHATVELDTPVPFRARYLAFYYPGWRVTVDGAPVPIAPTEPDGLISFDIPAGRHTIRVHFGETPLRLVADALSLVSLAGLLILVARPRQLISRPRHHVWRVTASHGTLGRQFGQIVLLLITAVLLLVAKLVLIDRVDTPFRRANLVDGRLRDLDVPAAVTFGDEFVLLGREAPSTVPSGGRLDVWTYWRALEPGGPDYGVTVNVVDAQGHRWNSQDVLPPRWHRVPPPVGEWPPDQYASVALSTPLLSGTPPGSYTLEAVAFDRETLAPLTAHDTSGRALGPALALGQVTVTAPSQPENPDALGIRHRLDAPLGPLTLLGADFDRAEAAPGDPILVTVFWHADQQPNADLTLHLELLAAGQPLRLRSAQTPAAEYDLPPAATWHPTTAWQPGDVWRGQHFLRLPAHLASGDYTWRLALEPVHQSVDLPSTIHVTAPSRVLTPPPLQHPVDVTLVSGGEETRFSVATLAGFDLETGFSGKNQVSGPRLRSGQALTVTLVWRAEAETTASYHVFLHLSGPDGQLVAQSDGIPADWTRPTTGWLPGEYVSDRRVLALPANAPAGDYALSAGLYIPGGERLTAPDGTDAIPLTTITVEER